MSGTNSGPGGFFNAVPVRFCETRYGVGDAITAPAVPSSLSYVREARYGVLHAVYESKPKLEGSVLRQEIIDFLDVHAHQWALVGSRVTCNPAPTDTNEDFLVLGSYQDTMDAIKTFMTAHGFAAGAEGEKYAINSENSHYYVFFESFRMGRFNLIFTQSMLFYDRFLVATNIARDMNLLDKKDRIAIFQAVLYGNGAWHTYARLGIETPPELAADPRDFPAMTPEKTAHVNPQRYAAITDNLRRQWDDPNGVLRDYYNGMLRDYHNGMLRDYPSLGLLLRIDPGMLHDNLMPLTEQERRSALGDL